ncbi:hypothetical protein ACUY3K_04330 [Corynebacterium uberis]
MTIQSQPDNPIVARKQEVRRLARNGVITAGVGVVGGLALGLLSHHLLVWLVLGLIVAVVGGGYNWLRIQRIVNHKDAY